MAVFTPNPAAMQNHTYTTTWVLTSADATGDALELPGAADKTVQIVSADYTGVVYVIEGSLDGTTYFTLTNPAGTAITGAANDLEAVLQNTKYIRPRLSTPGTGKTVTVTLLSRSTV